MATKTEIFAIINLVKRLPNSPITGNPEQVKQALEETVNLFHAVLEDLPSDMLKAATVQYCSEGNPFFPTPGVLRDKAMDLQMLALGIPTPAEAWGMVLTAVKHVQSVTCEEGARLRTIAAGTDAANGYWRKLADYGRHIEECEFCELGGFREDYTHTAVAETVRLLGGRDVILTDNPVSDRKQFIDAYRDVIARERMKMSMTPKVAEYIENNRPLLADDRRAALDTGEGKYLAAQSRELANRMTK